MPTYEFECEKCKTRFEEFLPITFTGKRNCPACGTDDTRKLISGGAGLVFKGSGFYTTDYRRPAESAGKSKPKGEPVTASSTESGKSDGSSPPSTSSSSSSSSSSSPSGDSGKSSKTDGGSSPPKSS